MINWTLSAELQAKLDSLIENNRRLQAELGIKSMTLEERHAAHVARQAELEKLASLTNRRPPPKWKV